MSRWEIFRLLAEWLRPTEWPRPPRIPERLPWPRIVSASSHHLVTPTIAWRLRGRPEVPVRAADYFDAVLALNRARNRQLADALALAVGRLNDAGVRPVLLKGASMLARPLYPDPAMRFCGDIDLLVPEEQLADASIALHRAGFVAAAPATDAGHHHLPIQIHGERGVGIELHRYPVATQWRELLEEEDYARAAAPVAVGDAEALLPEPARELATVMIHGHAPDALLQPDVPQLRRLLDVALHLIRRPNGIGSEEVEKRFEDRGHHAILARTLRLSRSLLLDDEPSADPAARAGLDSLRAAVERSFLHRALIACGGLARAAPRIFRKPPSDLARAMTAARWKIRLAEHYKRW